MLAASFSSAGSTFAGAGAADAAAAGGDPDCARSTRIFAFAARNVANSFDAAVSCSVSFATSAEALAVAEPPAPALAARASRSARHVLFGASGSVAGFAASSFARSLLAVATAARGASASVDAPVVVAVDADSLFSEVAVVTQPVEASSRTVDKIASEVRVIMPATEQQRPFHGKPYLNRRFCTARPRRRRTGASPERVCASAQACCGARAPRFRRRISLRKLAPCCRRPPGCLSKPAS